MVHMRGQHAWLCLCTHGCLPVLPLLLSVLVLMPHRACHACLHCYYVLFL